jgi:hypothetical protein
MKHSGKSLAIYTLMMWLVTVDRYEEEPKDISCVELSHDDCEELSDKQISDVTEEGFAVGDNARWGFDILCCVQTTPIHPIPRQTFPRTVFLTVVCLPGVGIRKNF